MLKTSAITPVLLIAIPVALFSQRQMEVGIVRNITTVTAAVLIFLAWDMIKKQQLARIDNLLLQTYLAGLFVFSLWLGLNSIVISTYDASFTQSRDASIRSTLLSIEPFVVYFGLAIAVVFAILCLTRIVITIRNYLRRDRSLKARNV